jgi:hypothetical protein
VVLHLACESQLSGVASPRNQFYPLILLVFIDQLPPLTPRIAPTTHPRLVAQNLIHWRSNISDHYRGGSHKPYCFRVTGVRCPPMRSATGSTIKQARYGAARELLFLLSRSASAAVWFSCRETRARCFQAACCSTTIHVSTGRCLVVIAISYDEGGAQSQEVGTQPTAILRGLGCSALGSVSVSRPSFISARILS